MRKWLVLAPLCALLATGSLWLWQNSQKKAHDQKVEESNSVITSILTAEELIDAGKHEDAAAVLKGIDVSNERMKNLEGFISSSRIKGEINLRLGAAHYLTAEKPNEQVWAVIPYKKDARSVHENRKLALEGYKDALEALGNVPSSNRELSSLAKGVEGHANARLAFLVGKEKAGNYLADAIHAYKIALERVDEGLSQKYGEFIKNCKLDLEFLQKSEKAKGRQSQYGQRTKRPKKMKPKPHSTIGSPRNPWGKQ